MNLSWLDILLVSIATIVAISMLRPRIRNADAWKATVTPLASIIGSGFLIVAPLLAAIAGSNATIAITIIVLLSFWIGSAVRLVISNEESLTNTKTWSLAGLENFSDLALAFAYAISIAFYIRLMSGFILSGFGKASDLVADSLATMVLLFIGVYGWRKGLHGLERLEEYSVTIKLAIIASLLFALGYTDWIHPPFEALPAIEASVWDQLRLLAGMLLIVQGFETSKYIGEAYSADLRRRSMLWAQILAGVIYISFVSLSVPLMSQLDLSNPNETAIIDLSRTITIALPIMLVIAAVMSQFSAAIADTLGSGGVISIYSGQRLSSRFSYLLVAVAAILIIWVADVFELVTYASRAFAFFYLLQAIIAMRLALQYKQGWEKYFHAGSYFLLSLVLLAIVIFGKSVAG